MVTLLDILSIISDVGIVISLIVAICTLSKDHKRSRREKSVDLIIKWSESLDKRTSLAKKYVEKLSKQQIQHLCNHEEIEFNASNKDEEKLYRDIKKLLNDCENDDEPTGSGILTLSAKESSELRWLAIKYLNMLESILIAWQHCSADDKIIEDEFEYMFDLTSGKDMLKEVRITMDSEKCYPAIEMFYTHLEEKRKKKLKRSKKL